MMENECFRGGLSGAAPQEEQCLSPIVLLPVPWPELIQC